jgi:hypothetical protein
MAEQTPRRPPDEVSLLLLDLAVFAQVKADCFICADDSAQMN